MLSNHGKYLKFPIKWKRGKKENDPPDLNALKEIVDLIHQKNEKTPVLQTKGSDRLM